MAERKKRGLGRGLGALIPDAVGSTERPVDVFFTGGETDETNGEHGETQRAPRAARTDPAATMQSSRRRKAKSSKATSVAKTPAAKAPATTSDPGDVAEKTGTTASNARKPAAKSTRAKSAAAKAPAAAKKPAAKKSTGSSRATSRSTGAGSAADTVRSSSKVETESSGTAANGTAEGLEVPDQTQTGAVAAEAAATPQGGMESVKSDASVDTGDVVESHPGVFTSETAFEVYDDGDTANVVIRESGSEDATDVAAEEGERGEVSFGSVIGSSDFDQSGLDEGSSSAAESADDVSSAAADAPSDDDALEGADGVLSIEDTEFGEVDVELIDPNPRQPRTVFDEDQLAELVHSIREIGVLQPVVVRQKPGDAVRYELIMGERRLRATKEAGLASIPAIIRHVADTDLLRDALLENLHRAELNPLEEAAAYGQLLEDFGCTQEELSARIGRSRPQISNTLRLLKLPPLVQRRVAAGVISAGHARAILGLKQAEHMEVLAQRIVAEGLSVRAAEEAVVLLNRGDAVNVSRGTSRVAPEFLAVAERLGDRLDTKVNISVGKRKGKLSVEFANQEDLDRILTLLGLQSNPW